MMRKLTLSLAAMAALAAGTAAYAQEQPKPEPRPPVTRAPMTRADVEQRTNAAFARMDANGDGVLDQADRDVRQKAKFDKVDTNKDGAISPEEFAARDNHRREPRQARAEQGDRPGPQMDRPRMDRRGGHRGGMGGMGGFGMARNADADGNGSVTQAEFTSAALARFDSADANKDGTISPDEMRSQRRDRRHDRGDHRRPPQAG